ncbi:hypothetical protein Hanom_Chr06g00538441 [Helianthus anomalus]
MKLRSSPTKEHQKDSPLKSQGIIKDPSKELYCFTDPEIDRSCHCFPTDTIFKPFDPARERIFRTWKIENIKDNVADPG